MIKKLNKKLLAGILAGGIVLTPINLSANNNENVIKTWEGNSYFVPSDCDENIGIGYVKDHTMIYTGPGNTYPKATDIPANTQVDVKGVSDNGWYFVSYNGIDGFIDRNCLKTITENDIISTIQATTSVNVRSNANAESNLLGTLEAGDSLDMLNKLENGWYRVLYNDRVAFVCGDYVRECNRYNGESIKNVFVHSDTSLFDIHYGNKIADIPYLELCKVYGEVGEYYLVEVNGEIGYVLKDYCSPLNGVYVVVDISDQKLTLYHDNNELLSTSVTTGKDSTPSDLGLFYIYDKSVDTILSGDGYDSFVNYWMPYNEGEGLHDAPWRSYFGGDDYHYGGSHGCINMPYNAAQYVYSNTQIGNNVLVKK